MPAKDMMARVLLIPNIHRVVLIILRYGCDEKVQ